MFSKKAYEKNKQKENIIFLLPVFFIYFIKSSGAIIRGGKPASLVQLAIIDLRNGKRNLGHSISKILSRISFEAFSMVKIPQ